MTPNDALLGVREPEDHLGSQFSDAKNAAARESRSRAVFNARFSLRRRANSSLRGRERSRFPRQHRPGPSTGADTHPNPLSTDLRERLGPLTSQLHRPLPGTPAGTIQESSLLSRVTHPRQRVRRNGETSVAAVSSTMANPHTSVHHGATVRMVMVALRRFGSACSRRRRRRQPSPVRLGRG